MHIADLPNSTPKTVVWITSIEPWQREGLLHIREELGIDADGLLRAGITLALALVGAINPDTATPPEPPGDVENLNAHTTQATRILPPGDLIEEGPPGHGQPG